MNDPDSGGRGLSDTNEDVTGSPPRETVKESSDLGVEPGGVLDGIRVLGLSTTFVGRRVHYLVSVPSTMAELARVAEQGEPEGTVVLADEQTEGRGRSGRTWFSPRGSGIWASVLLRPEMLPERLAPLSLAVAVSIADALAGFTGADVRVKWPNDLVAGSRKLGGVLVESFQIAGEAVGSLAVGIGLNVNTGRDEFPSELSSSATSIKEILGESVSRLDVLRLVLDDFESCWNRFRRGGIEEFTGRWRELSTTLGREVSVQSGGEHIAGTVTGLSEFGALLVETVSGGESEIWYGDVTLSQSESRGRGEEARDD